jgi:hypothetical protein
MNFDRKSVNSDTLFQIRLLQALPSKPTVSWIDENTLSTSKKAATVKKLKQLFGLEDS